MRCSRPTSGVLSSSEAGGAARHLRSSQPNDSNDSQRAPERGAARYPSLAQIAGHAMSSIFLDSLAVDIERLERVNKTLSMLPPELLEQTPLKPVKLLVIAPSERLDDIASRHIASLPAPIRTMLSGIGATETRGAALASYLLFESTYTCELIRLGQRDTQARKEDVLAFFDS